MAHVLDTTNHVQLLSEILLATRRLAGETPVAPHAPSAETCFSPSYELVAGLQQQDLDDVTALAHKNHVIVRSFGPLGEMLEAQGKSEAAAWVANAVEQEIKRRDHAVTFLAEICARLEKAGCPAVVIKSLDHWPDIGSDLDLFTDGDPDLLINTMRSEFNAELEDRSWGDRLANKWNFAVPGLAELVEVHVRRLGQTGEQTAAITQSLTSRSHSAQIGGRYFRVAAPEDRIVISTLQRMYRHFYIRLCDIVDNAALLDAGKVNFAYLSSLGSAAGLWQGIATYLNIISQYVESYRGTGVPLPETVTSAAKFGIEQVRFQRDFIRVSIMPHSVNLYASELRALLFKGELRNTFRLSLLPCLATAAAFEQKRTGSDKGIW